MTEPLFEKPYHERVATVNIGEKLFKEYCKKKKVQCFKFGFDEVDCNVPEFYKLHPMIRSFPDFIIYTPQKEHIFCHVKGTRKLKVCDFNLYKAFHNRYCENHKTFIVFCFSGKDPIFKTLDQVDVQLKKGVVRKYPDNNEEYVEINLK